MEISQVQLTSYYNDNVYIIIVYCLVKQFHLAVLLVVFVEMFLHVHMPDTLSFQYHSYKDIILYIYIIYHMYV